LPLTYGAIGTSISSLQMTKLLKPRFFEQSFIHDMQVLVLVIKISLVVMEQQCPFINHDHHVQRKLGPGTVLASLPFLFHTDQPQQRQQPGLAQPSSSY
jgi:hypothetical protein